MSRGTSMTALVRSGAGAAALLLPVLVVGCATAAPADPPPPPTLELAGNYSGSMTVDANFLPATLTVTQEGETIQIRLSVPDLGAVTQGTGTAGTERFTFRVPYELNCPGEATFEGRVDEEGAQALVGTLRAVDCDGVLNGTFRFARQGA